MPSTKQLLPFVSCMASNWYEVGAMLLDVTQEPQLKTIRATHGNDVKKCCLAMLQKWMDTHPEATWQFIGVGTGGARGAMAPPDFITSP